MGTLFAELAARAGAPTGPRIYADANVPAGIIAFMRKTLQIGHAVHRTRRFAACAGPTAFRAGQATRAHAGDAGCAEYLDDRMYPPGKTSGLIVLYAPTEQLLTRTLQQIDERVFQGYAVTRRSFRCLCGDERLVANRSGLKHDHNLVRRSRRACRSRRLDPRNVGARSGHIMEVPARARAGRRRRRQHQQRDRAQLRVDRCACA